MIKEYLLAVLLLQLVSACSNRDMLKPGYDYVKIMTFRDVYPGDAYNKGQGIWSYFYYNPSTDSVLLRKGQSFSDDSSEFTTYEGQFENRQYADPISLLISNLKNYKEGELSFQFDSTDGAYCGPEFSVEYSINSQPHFISFEIINDTLQKFVPFYGRLSRMPWDKKTVPNNRINETEETVHMLKSLGWYDSIVYTPPYIPLPCEKGIKMELLYGKWRTIGDKYNNANLRYWKNTIGKDGSWKLERIIEGELRPRFSGKITSIGEDQMVQIKNDKREDGIVRFKIINLTENCLEYIDGANQTWRYDRMQ